MAAIYHYKHIFTNMFVLIFSSCIFAALAFSDEICHDSDVKEFLAGNVKFSGRVYKELVKVNKNFISSPFSLEVILGLTDAGARGQTNQELLNGVNFPSTQAKTENAFKKLLPNFKTDNGTLKLLSANKIYAQTGLSIKPGFQKEAVDVFQAETENVDFAKKDSAANIINAWVEKQTNNKIRNLLDPALIKDDTRLVLVNALYFLGNWTIPFGKHNLITRKEKFYTSPNNSVTTNIMHAQGQFGYYESKELNAQFLELPYNGGASMVVVLPSTIDGLRQLENNIEEVLKPQYFSKEFLEVGLPRWKTETNINFNSILNNLGVKTLFTDRADLSGISDSQLKVSSVVQKAFINVTETGTEAAAATAVSIGTTAIIIAPKLIIDHPFLYYIKYEEVILFIGRILSPDNINNVN